MKPSLIGFSSGGALVSDWLASADFASLAHPAMRPAPAVPAMPRASARTTSLRFQVLLLMLSSGGGQRLRSEEHTSELQSQSNLVCRLLLEKKKKKKKNINKIKKI